jgi:hypothetical protein
VDDSLPSHRFSTVRRAVAAIALCWLSFLFWLAATSGNPVVLNKVQILRSDCVVTAEVTSIQLARVLRVWKGDAPTLPVAFSLDELLQDGEYIVPLVRVGNQFVVTPLPLLNDGKEVRVVYPLTAQTRTQLETLLGDAEQNDAR